MLRRLRALLIGALFLPLLLGADTAGKLRVSGPLTPTYAASTATFTPAASATDIWTITGSATKTVRVLSVVFSGTQTTAGTIATPTLIKRSTADTAGTAVACTRVPLDSQSAAATAVCQTYTANPTTGTTVGAIRGPRVLLPAPTTTTSVLGAAPVAQWDFMTEWSTPVTLRGTAEALSLNMGGGALPTGAANFQVDVLWTEE